MSAHLTESEIVDLADGIAGESLTAHASHCAECQARVETFAAALREAREADVPEPSPEYWQAFRREVEARLEQEARPWWRSPLRPLPVLVTLAVAVVLAVGLVGPRAPQPPATLAPAPMPAWSALPEVEDGGLLVIEALGAPVEDTATEGCRAAYDCLASLSDAESEAVLQAMKTEIEGRQL